MAVSCLLSICGFRLVTKYRKNINKSTLDFHDLKETQHRTEVYSTIAMIYSLYIINRAGGLIYHTDFRPGLNKLSSNEYLMLAGTIQGVFAIASKVTPTALKLKGGSRNSSTQVSSGLRAIETSAFTIFISQTVTGVKFLLIASPSTDDIDRAIEAADAVLQKVYCLYADYVMKNPFHSLDMPIRAQLFDRKVSELMMSI